VFIQVLEDDIGRDKIARVDDVMLKYRHPLRIAARPLAFTPTNGYNALVELLEKPGVYSFEDYFPPVVDKQHEIMYVREPKVRGYFLYDGHEVWVYVSNMAAIALLEGLVDESQELDMTIAEVLSARDL